MPNPYVFIVGCPRSGTTLMQRVVNAHSEIAIMPEAHWIRRLFDEQKGLTPEGLVTPEAIPYLLAQPQFVGLNLDQAELEELLEGHQPISFAGFVASIFDQYGKIRGKAFFGSVPLKLEVTDHFLVPAVNWRGTTKDGEEANYADNQWHLIATPVRKTADMRFLTVVQISMDGDNSVFGGSTCHKLHSLKTALVLISLYLTVLLLPSMKTLSS